MTIATLSQLQDLDEFCRAVGVDKTRVLGYANAPSQKVFYQQLYIPKRGKNRRGQFRVVHKAMYDWLSGMHRSIAMLVNNSTTFGIHVQGFVKDRSIKSNAALHLGASKILHADIKDFFDQIRTEHVQHALVALGTSLDLAKILAKASTIDGFLSQGTRCSPALANSVCRRLDDDLLLLAANSKALYSRYADDLVFSGLQVPEKAAIEHILIQHGFSVRPHSFVTQHRGKSQFVTGLSITDPTQPRLQRRLKKRLRLVSYYVGKYGAEEHFQIGTASVVSTAAQLNGMMWFVKGIEPVFADKLLAVMSPGV